MLALLTPAAASARTITDVWCGGKGPRTKPKACEFYSRPGVAGTYVTGMRWHHWGGRRATATGVFRGNMGVHSSVKVRLSRRDTCQVGNPRVRAYTRALFKFRGDSKWRGGRIVGCDGT
jgi:hypothetical protein